MSSTRHICINCGHGSLVRNNFKFTNDGKAYCVQKCLEVYKARNYNSGARREGECDA